MEVITEKVHGHTSGLKPSILKLLSNLYRRKVPPNTAVTPELARSLTELSLEINREVCVLIDVGTKPTNSSIYHLWKAFDKNAAIGGACGEIYAELGSGCSNLLNPLVAAQNFVILI